MHPILLRIPLPERAVPLFALLLAAAGLAGVAALVQLARKNRGGAVTPGLGALVLAGLAFQYQGTSWQMGPLPVYSYGVMLGLSLFVGWFITLGLAERDGLPREVMANNYVFTAVAALAGSRVLYVLTNLDKFQGLGDVFAVREGGLVAYGGFLGGLFGSIAFLRYHRLPLLPWADVAVPSLATGLFFTRIGCYLFGCDFGMRLSDSAPSVLRKLGTFPHWQETVAAGDGSPAWAKHVGEGLVSPDAASSLPVHPTQIYESLVGLSIFGLLLLGRKKQSFRGQIFFLFFFAYGVCRYLLEMVRDDAERGFLSTPFAPHVLHPLALGAFGVGFVLTFSAWIRPLAVRRALQAIALVAPVVAWLATRPESFALEAGRTAALSTSQGVALVTGLGACVLFALYFQASQAHPKLAMAIVLPPEFGGAAPRDERVVVADDDSDRSTGEGEDEGEGDDDEAQEPDPEAKNSPPLAGKKRSDSESED